MVEKFPSQDAILSEFADDPDMIELIEEFVQSMPERIAALESAFGETDLEEVQRLAHQLKGASGGYGFDAVGEVAGKLEGTIRAHATPDLEAVQAELHDLINICARVAN